MPWMRRKTVERVVTLRTTVLDERLREAERRVSNAETARGELERRLARSESTAASSAAAVGDQRSQLAEFSQQVETRLAGTQTEVDKRFRILEELMSAMGQRAREDRRAVDEQLSALETSFDAASASIERQVSDLARRIDSQTTTDGPSSSELDSVRADLARLASDVSTLTINMRGELARAVDAVRSSVARLQSSSSTRDEVIDLTGPPTIVQPG
jgi:chromosome segregation ATPase